MANQMTAREAVLAARVAELEAAEAGRMQSRTGGNIVEQIWRYFRAFVPVWIVALALIVFGGFQAIEYYQGGQREAAVTRLKEAQAKLKDADAVAQRLMVNGQPARVERLRADAELKQKQAAQAEIEAKALNEQVDGMTARLKAVELEVANKQYAAKLAQVEADAKWERQSDGRTLEEHIAESKAIISEIDAINAKWGAAIMGHGSTWDALCANRFAKAINCPMEYQRVWAKP